MDDYIQTGTKIPVPKEIKDTSRKIDQPFSFVLRKLGTELTYQSVKLRFGANKARKVSTDASSNRGDGREGDARISNESNYPILDYGYLLVAARQYRHLTSKYRGRGEADSGPNPPINGPLQRGNLACDNGRPVTNPPSSRGIPVCPFPRA